MNLYANRWLLEDSMGNRSQLNRLIFEPKFGDKNDYSLHKVPAVFHVLYSMLEPDYFIFLRVCSEAFQLIFQEEINFDKIQPFWKFHVFLLLSVDRLSIKTILFTETADNFPFYLFFSLFLCRFYQVFLRNIRKKFKITESL